MSLKSVLIYTKMIDMKQKCVDQPGACPLENLWNPQVDVNT